MWADTEYDFRYVRINGNLLSALNLPVVFGCNLNVIRNLSYSRTNISARSDSCSEKKFRLFFFKFYSIHTRFRIVYKFE
jgi:hypothetical protein